MNLLVEDLAIVTTDPESGRGQVVPAVRDTLLEGALLLDLVEAGCAQVFVDDARIGHYKKRVRLSPPSGPLPPLLAGALARARPQATPIHGDKVMHRMGKGLIRELRAHLIRRGIWREHRRRVLLAFSVITFPAADGYAHELRDRLTRILAGEFEPTPRDLALAAVLTARKEFRAVLSLTRAEAGLAQRRVEQLIDHGSQLGLVRDLVRGRSLGAPAF